MGKEKILLIVHCYFLCTEGKKVKSINTCWFKNYQNPSITARIHFIRMKA